MNWIKKRNKSEDILKINTRQAPRSDSERVFIHSDFELLKMGGIKAPVNGFGILLRGKYLEFVNLCGLKLTGEIHFGEMGNLECSYSACDNWIAQNLDMPLLKFHNCSIKNFQLDNSKIQQWVFNNCNLDGELQKSQLSMVSVIGGNFKPVIRDCKIFNFEIEKEKNQPDKNLYAYKTIKKIYADQGDDSKAIDYFIKEKDYLRNNSTGFEYLLKTLSKFYWGYGRKPHRIIWFSLFVIFTFALFYFLSHNLISINAGDFKELTFIDSLYFSTTTFTTLGFGDLSPSGWLRILTTLEAFLGVINMGFLIAGYANNKY